MINPLRRIVAVAVGTAVAATLILAVGAPAEATAAWQAPAKGAHLSIATRASNTWTTVEAGGYLELYPSSSVEPPTTFPPSSSLAERRSFSQVTSDQLLKSTSSAASARRLFSEVVLETPPAGYAVTGHDDAAATKKFLSQLVSDPDSQSTLGGSPSAQRSAAFPSSLGSYQYSYVTATSGSGDSEYRVFVGARVFTAQKKVLFIVTAATGSAAHASAVTTSTLNQLLLLDSGHVVTPKPVVSGALVRGSTLTAHLGSRIPAGAKLSYQWSANGKAIGGATKPTFALGAAQVGKVLTVTVTGRHSGRTVYSSTSVPTAKVDIPYLPINDLANFTAGITYQGVDPQDPASANANSVPGSPVTASVGRFAGATVKLQWGYFDPNTYKEKLIVGATGATFTPSSAYLGDYVFVVATVTKPGYHTAVVPSDTFVLIVPNLV